MPSSTRAASRTWISSTPPCSASSPARSSQRDKMNHAIRIDHAALDALLTRWNRDDAPGLVAGVVHPEAGSWKRAHGLASMSLPVLNTARTRMRIGSVSKMFTCLAVMLLAEEGKLDPDAPVRGHFPELPEWADAMTFRHWMNHTSGMRCHLDLLLQGGGWSRPSPASALPLLVRQRGVNFAPGALWSYNNSAYQLLSLLVERVSGQRFEAFLERNVLA